LIEEIEKIQKIRGKDELTVVCTAKNDAREKHHARARVGSKRGREAMYKNIR
jgi:CO dehydrogenase/acetyl-CoA synthase epsilon subunit